MSRTFSMELGIALSILFASNTFFVKRLVDKLDSMELIVWQLRQDIVVLQAMSHNEPRKMKHE